MRWLDKVLPVNYSTVSVSSPSDPREPTGAHGDPRGRLQPHHRRVRERAAHRHPRCPPRRRGQYQRRAGGPGADKCRRHLPCRGGGSGRAAVAGAIFEGGGRSPSSAHERGAGLLDGAAAAGGGADRGPGRLGEGGCPRTRADPSGPAVDPSGRGVDPSGPAVDPSGPTVDPSGPVVDPSGPVVDPSGPTVDPSGPGVDPSGPGVDPSGPGVDPSGPGVHPSGPGVHPRGPAVDPSGPAVDPSGPAVDPSGPGVDPSGPGVDPSGPGVDPSGPGVDSSGPGVDPSEPGVDPSGPAVSSGRGRGWWCSINITPIECRVGICLLPTFDWPLTREYARSPPSIGPQPQEAVERLEGGLPVAVAGEGGRCEGNAVSAVTFGSDRQSSCTVELTLPGACHTSVTPM
eukprot:1196311-Prorocentrum_minimum.AAC.4